VSCRQQPATEGQAHRPDTDESNSRHGRAG
jgi:hypothetical protein